MGTWSAVHAPCRTFAPAHTPSIPSHPAAPPRQDFFYVSIGMHGASAEGMQFTWDFFQQNLQRYIDKCGPGAASLMDAVIAGACGGFATEAKAAEVKAFFEASPMPRNERTIAQKVESIGTSAKYLSAFTASGALEWLKDFESKSGFGGD
jgi:hypothetical protein